MVITQIFGLVNGFCLVEHCRVTIQCSICNICSKKSTKANLMTLVWFVIDLWCYTLNCNCPSRSKVNWKYLAPLSTWLTCCQMYAEIGTCMEEYAYVCKTKSNIFCCQKKPTHSTDKYINVCKNIAKSCKKNWKYGNSYKCFNCAWLPKV